MTPLEIRTLPIRDLTPAPYNPRKPLKPTDPAYRKLRDSLREFGLVEPPVWNELTGHVVGGHLRLRVLLELGYETVSVSVVRLDEIRERALNVVLNNLEAQGRYDPERLAEVLEALRDTPGFALTGFDESDLANLRYEPAEVVPLVEAEEGRVEVSIVTDAITFSRLEPRLDELVREFDLETHMRRR